jgi:hypothetical protein
MSAAGERVLYGMAYWLRRGDTQAVSDLAATLDETERAEARELFDVPGVPQTLRDLPEEDLQARMFELAGKAEPLKECIDG